MEITLVSDFSERIVAFASVNDTKDQIVINTDNEGFEGLHDISVHVKIP